MSLLIMRGPLTRGHLNIPMVAACSAVSPQPRPRLPDTLLSWCSFVDSDWSMYYTIITYTIIYIYIYIYTYICTCICIILLSWSTYIHILYPQEGDPERGIHPTMNISFKHDFWVTWKWCFFGSPLLDSPFRIPLQSKVIRRAKISDSHDTPNSRCKDLDIWEFDPSLTLDWRGYPDKGKPSNFSTQGAFPP